MATETTEPHREPIAVVGYAGRFPGAADTAEFWRKLRAGADCVDRPDDDALLARGATEAEISHPDYVRAVPLMPDADRFDAALFGMTPRDAALQDPQHRVFLETVHAALENAGYDPFAEAEPTGVFGGSAGSGYLLHHLSGNAAAGRVDPTTLGIAGNASYLATLTSYRLSLTGPSISVGTACSTSLVALHLAVAALRAGTCGIAVAGGVEIEFPFGQGYQWGPASIYSREGVCRPFDAAADGTVFGSGAGVVVLKPLSAALRDGDTVRAVIRGTAVNNDGSDKVSFGAPSVSGQVRVIKEAMREAGLDPADIDYVEAHGTGTKIGDPLEVAALTEAYRELAAGPLASGTIPIGSVKSNVGHLGPAAGICGLIKTIMAMEHGEIPPSINYRTPNPAIDFAATPFAVNDEVRPWPRAPHRTRTAAVSSFGVGGTNAHVIVSEPPAENVPEPSGTPRLLVWSARDAHALDQTRQRLAEAFADEVADFDAAAHTLFSGRTHHRVRAAAVAATPAEAAELLTGDVRGVHRGPETGGNPRDLCFLYPGQGSQRVRMAEGLYRELPAFASAFDECLDLFAEEGVELRDAWQHGVPDALEDTALAQPALFAVEYALTRALSEEGVRPTVVLGHSLGELVAATTAGVFDLADAVRVVAARGRLMAQMAPGAMLAVSLPATDLGDLAAAGVALAAVNGAAQTTVSGPADAIEALRSRLAEEGVRSQVLHTSHAFHSPSMTEAAERFAAVLARVELREPRLRLVSAATGREITAEQAVSPGFWAGQLVEPVRFHPAVEHLLSAGDHLIIEVGPGQALSGLVRQHPAVVRGTSGIVPTSPRTPDAEADLRAWLAALAVVFVEGHELDRPAPSAGRRVPLPGYPYQRERHWIDPAPRASGSAPAAGAETPEPPAHSETTLEEKPAVSPFSSLSWYETPLPTASLRTPGRVLALLPADHAQARPVLGALHQAGHQVFRVRPGDRLTLGEEEFTVRPGRTDDLAAVLDELSRRSAEPHGYVHAWAAASWEAPTPKNCDDQLAAGCLSLFDVFKIGSRRPVDGALPEITVVTSGAVDVSGGESPHPMKAMLTGLVATYLEEAPGARCRLVDFGARPDERLLADEFLSENPEPFAAWRGARRWQRTEAPLDVVPASGTALREEGVYLVTGGLGGLGLETAKGLVHTGLRPRIALLGRRVPDGAPALAPEAATRVRTAVAEMEALGAEVAVIACDVSDPESTAAAVASAVERFGPVNGVVHCAGVAGGGVIQLRDHADVLKVVRPKVLGTLLLNEAVEAGQRPAPDFFVAFSSRSGTHGLVGSGDYAAANAFLDAYVLAGRGRTRSVSIGWPSWRRVGMAAQEIPAAPRPERTADDGTVVAEEVVDASTHWVLDEHRIDGVPVMPGTGQIDFVLRAWQGRGGEQGATRLEDVTFLRPLAVASARRLQVIARPGRDVERFTLRSRDVAGGEWTEHTTGAVRLVESLSRRIDLPLLEARIENDADSPAPVRGDTGLVTFGPRWDNIGRAVRGADEDLVELVLPAAFAEELPAHVLHPALLDGATATAQRPADFSRLPFHYRSVTVFGRLPVRFWAHLRYRSADQHAVTVDIDLIDPDGRLVVAIDGFTMRKAAREAVTGAFSEQPAPRGGTPVGGRALPGAVDEHSGLEPHQGVRLFLRLLDAPTPAHVLVRSYENGAPLPLADARPQRWAERPDSLARTAAATPAVVPAGAAPRPATAPVPTPPATAPLPAADDAATAGGPGDGGSDEVAREIRTFWSQALGIPDIDEDADFFELGGNSLTAIELMGRIHDRFGVELSVALLFECPTVALLAGAVREQQGR
ncbi:SDR family NAD(P)-dependent oxidoreductase [Streptomyces sp. NPDC047434]|uniref:type I polyketide synthase n=1 Tax=Streptomyces sp. NPDC047434 TaxID=3155143 RepID=UPI0033EF9F58